MAVVVFCLVFVLGVVFFGVMGLWNWGGLEGLERERETFLYSFVVAIE